MKWGRGETEKEKGYSSRQRSFFTEVEIKKKGGQNNVQTIEVTQKGVSKSILEEETPFQRGEKKKGPI